jgi:type II secretory pathway component PulM
MDSFTNKLTQTFERMSQRERLMVAGLGATLAVLLMALFGYLIFDGLDTRRAQNERMRYVLKRLEKNRDRLVAKGTQDDRLYRKIEVQPPPLKAHLDGLAKEHEVEVNAYKTIKEKQLGAKKDILEKAVEIDIHNIELPKLMKFLNAIEASGSRYLIMTTKIQMSPRSSDHGKLDVSKLRVSTYERTKVKASKSKSKGRSSKGKR